MSSQKLRKSVLCVAMGLCLSSMAQMALAQDGAVVGQSEAGAQITVRNPATGFIRTVTAGADGNYRFPFLPVGEYTLEAAKDGAAVEPPRVLTVGLGTTTNAGAAVDADGVSTLGRVEVVGSRIMNAVDVTSTESATNITLEELDRLPVARDAQSVALLAPGVVDGSFGGISFGGSSVSENTVYINGLNVTDFYRRVGFSSVPFSFFKEFQIKTGGYSAEFGRSTGGVINAVTQSGTNEFRFGSEFLWEPSSLQAEGSDGFNAAGERIVSRQHDHFDRRNLNLYASGPIIRDRLFFYGMYEFRDLEQTVVTNDELQRRVTSSDEPFWGAKLDWQINDNHQLELLAFSDKNQNTRDDFCFNSDDCDRDEYQNTRFTESGGLNWAATYTGYLTDSLSVKALYGGNERQRVAAGATDADCNRVRDLRTTPARDIGCTSNGILEEGLDDREAARLDFEWSLGDHLLRFGLDREVNTSSNETFYPGRDRLLYEIRATTGGATVDGFVVPPGATAYVRTRQQETTGTFETLNTAYYIEDNWSVTPNLVLNLGLRLEAFDNKNADGESFIKLDDMLAPRLGFSWDMRGDGRSKLFGNAGRYYLPVVNEINIKQSGAFLDERVYYVLNGFEPYEYGGQTYQRPILGTQFGFDNEQGDGTVGDLSGDVDADIDPVYQDEFILGFQSMINDTWSWGVKGIYRELTNAIDDIGITTTSGTCGFSRRFIMGNPGKPLTINGDANCDGINDGFVTIDLATQGYLLRNDAGAIVGQRGWVEPERTYKAVELVLDRAWDEKWAFNASYTLAYSRGNAEGPSNSDFGFDNTGRTESFDDPFVNLNGEGYLPNDRRHQFKIRGSYAINDALSFGATLNAQSGGPLSGFGVGNPFDNRVYHSFYICVDRCGIDPATRTPSTPNGRPYLPSQRVYELSPRGSYGNLPWTYDLGASISYKKVFGSARFRLDFSVFNLLNQERVVSVNQVRQGQIRDETNNPGVAFNNPEFLEPNGYQSPRSAQLRLSVDF